MVFSLPLMEDNITREDLKEVVNFLSQEDIPILTNGTKCREFEELWSEWLGVKYSVFVNSGSAANTITLQALRELNGVGEIIVPPLTWVSDILAVTRAGFTPRFVDIDKRNLAMNTDLIISAINDKTKGVFLTHILGFNGLNDKLIIELKKRGIPLIEDVCESHGATFKGRKLGTFGLASNFSFYFAHHMSTIEGGMICTDDKDMYEYCRMIRSHGMVRECTDEELKRTYELENPDLRKEFIFAVPGYNFRSTEINAVLGISQLKRLDENNRKRRANFETFISNLDPAKYYTDYDIEGSCNYAFTLMLREEDHALCQSLIDVMEKEGIEFRRGMSGGGNQLRQPYLRKLIGNVDLSEFPVVDFVHFFGFYIGNYPSLNKDRILRLCEILNSVEVNPKYVDRMSFDGSDCHT